MARRIAAEGRVTVSERRSIVSVAAAYFLAAPEDSTVRSGGAGDQAARESDRTLRRLNRNESGGTEVSRPG